MTRQKFSLLAPEPLGRELPPPPSAVAVEVGGGGGDARSPGGPPSEQNRPQQVEWIDQELGLLGEEMEGELEMVIEELEMVVVGERERMLVLGQVEQKGAKLNLPLSPPLQSPQAKGMKLPQPLEVSSCGEQEESQNSPLRLRG